MGAPALRALPTRIQGAHRYLALRKISRPARAAAAWVKLSPGRLPFVPSPNPKAAGGPAMSAATVGFSAAGIARLPPVPSDQVRREPKFEIDRAITSDSRSSPYRTSSEARSTHHGPFVRDEFREPTPRIANSGFPSIFGHPRFRRYFPASLMISAERLPPISVSM